MNKKPITIKEIAKKLNLSASSVSRALHDHPTIGLSTRIKVKKLAEQLGYVPNLAAISFQKGKTNTIGVIVPELSEAFFATAISAIEDVANHRNYTVLFAQSHDDEEKEKKLVEKMLNHRVDGLLISLSKTTSNFSHVEAFKKNRIPLVFFDCIPARKDIHYVVCNMETGTVEAVNYLLKKGHRTIGLINGPTTLYASKERKEGYIKAFTKNRLKFDPSLVIDCDLTEKGAEEAFDILMNNKRKPSAIVTFNDYIALYAINHAKKQGLDLSKDIEFVSYSNLPLFKYIDFGPKASVEQFPYRQGEKSAEILLDLIHQQENSNEDTNAYYKVYIESQLVEKG
ncbi:LacI family DNA-binding transcriptional regulator [Pseudopedobacter saltans]|uniref:LacI family DNA-binding transcriptional regulator n=1 Tax=Pseudopedobacter saltans TaxID=151895 RepID=UPI0005A08FD3|nr:LacI family DNA-binding transcriptional regulator [Pseudopedobacter saltans]